MSEMITKNHALVAQFGDTLDRLRHRELCGKQPSDIGRRTLPDGQGGVGKAESEPPYLAGLPKQRGGVLLPIGRQNPVQRIRH